jgi:hypothetical protein
MNLNPINSRLLVPLGGAIILAMFAALPARADYQSTVLAQNPAGYWRLNETTQPAPNATTPNLGSLAGAIGTYNGAPTHQLPGPFAGSLAVGLDGSSQSVTTPFDAALNPNTFSVELWVNPAVVPKFAYVASSVHLATSRSGWYLAQDDGSTFGNGSAFVLRMFYQNTTTPSITLWAPVDVAGVWYHLVITYDGTTATMYTNGVVAMSGAPAGYVGNVDIQTSFGVRSDNSFFWPGQQAEVAMYTGALSAARVSAHYTTATTTPANYVATVQADSPVLYYRFREASDVTAANIGTLGSAATGKYAAGTTPGVAGPRLPPYPGFEAGNDAVSFDATGPSVAVPALNFNTNTVTITGWVKPSSSSQTAYGGLIVCHAGTTDAGLIMDFNGGLGVGYRWGNDNGTFNWSPSSDSFLPNLPASDWAYVALVVQANQAAIYLCDSTNSPNWAGVTNPLVTSHASQAFDGSTLFGWSAAPGFLGGFAGNIDEVAMFNRALGEGELYTQYGAAVGGLKPILFGDLQGPPGSVAAGDPLSMMVDAGGTPPLTFIWRTNGVPAATTSSNTLVIASSRLSDTASYDVIISNAWGTVPSSPVSVSVVTPSLPTISQLLGYQSRTLYPTGTLSFAVSATGGGLKYQWYKNASPIASATSAAYSIASVTTNDAGSYSVSVTNSVGIATSGPPAVITIPSVTAGSYEAAIVNSAPEAWWRLDEPVGSTNMFDGMGRHPGTYTNASGAGPLPTLGVTGALLNDPNTAASFTSTGQGIGLVPFSPNLNTPQYSAEAWVNTSVMNAQAPVSSSFGNAGVGWWMQSDGGWWDGGPGGFGNNIVNGTHVNTNAAIIPGYWSHIVIEYDVTRQISGSYYPFTLYVNGQTDGYVWGAPAANSGGPLIIGGRGYSATTLADSFFDGEVDEVAIYKRLLSSTEIQAHFTARGTVLVPPTFTTPLLPQTVTTGKSISFSTVVLGTAPISLQWYKDGARITNATSATYAITNTALGDTGTYTLWAMNVVATNSISATLTVYSPFAYANVTNNLVLHLQFEGDTTDSSGRGNNGTPSTSTPSNAPPVFVPGIIGSQALQYTTFTTNGSGTAVTNASYVSLGTQGSGPPTDLRFGASTSFSVSLWVKQPAGSLYGDLPFIGTATNSDNNPGWVLAPGYQNGGWEWNLKDDGGHNINVGSTTPLINDGKWHHFLVSVDRAAAIGNTYLDGVLAASTSISAIGDIDIGNTAPVVIGQDPTFLYTEPGTAILDDIGIWRQALTPLQAAQIESAGRTSGRSFNTVGPQSVTLTITRGAGGNVVLNYSAGTLLQSTNVTLPMSQWTPVPGANPPSFSVAPSGAGNFYRVQAQ